jgi:xanthine dehydrogenase accessory factor
MILSSDASYRSGHKGFDLGLARPFHCRVTRDLLQAIATAKAPVALATILDVRGSAPRHAGSKMLVNPDGGSTGSVGGGHPEARALAACRECFASGKTALLHIESRGATILDRGGVCGGTSTVLIERVTELGTYRQIQGRLEYGERVLLIKKIRDGQESPEVVTALVDEGGKQIAGDFRDWEADAAARALCTGKPRFDRDAGVFYDPLVPEEKLVILGAGHVGHALALAAAPLGFRITVIDDRAELLGPERFPPEVDRFRGDFAQLIADLPLDTWTYIVVVTRNHGLDLTCVRALLPRKSRYVGVMGSARKTRMMVEQLHQEGFDPARIDALFTPVGMNIDAETPPELAVSILAEIVAVRHNSKTVATLKQAHAARRAAAVI